MTARSTMASWKDSTVWYRQRRPRQGAIEHSKTSGPLSICLQENWTIAKSAYPLEVRKNQETHANRDSIANIAGAQKRMVSMMARVAKTNERATNWMVGLTVAISVMTLIVIVLAFLMWKK